MIFNYLLCLNMLCSVKIAVSPKCLMRNMLLDLTIIWFWRYSLHWPPCLHVDVATVTEFSWEKSLLCFDLSLVVGFSGIFFSWMLDLSFILKVHSALRFIKPLATCFLDLFLVLAPQRLHLMFSWINHGAKSAKVEKHFMDSKITHCPTNWLPLWNSIFQTPVRKPWIDCKEE